MKERTSARNAPRVPVRLEGALVVGSDEGERTLAVVTSDIGVGGASVESPEILDAGTSGTLHLVLQEARTEKVARVSLAATVARAEPGDPCRLALTFAGSRPAAVETLKRYIFRARDRR